VNAERTFRLGAPKWIVKSATQRVISWLPASHRVNEWFQNTFRRSFLMPEAKFLLKVEEARKYLLAYQTAQTGGAASGFRAFELGTGWFPILPAVHFLCGGEKIWTVDIAPLPNTERVRVMTEHFLSTLQSGALLKVLPEAKPDRISAFQELRQRLVREPVAQALQAIGVYFEVRDGRATGLPAASVDLVYSSGVLHHIPLPVLRGMFTEFHRILRPGGIMAHRLHMIDQFSFFDRSITPFNSLRYTARQWRWLDSPLTPQNRLRITDYRKLFAESGFKWVHEENRLGLESDLAKVPLAPEFTHYSREDLLVIESIATARKEN
jgi:hypothetical protein